MTPGLLLLLATQPYGEEIIPTAKTRAYVPYLGTRLNDRAVHLSSCPSIEPFFMFQIFSSPAEGRGIRIKNRRISLHCAASQARAIVFGSTGYTFMRSESLPSPDLAVVEAVRR